MENKSQSVQLEDGINFGKLANAVVINKKQVGSIVVGCTLLAAGISFLLPKQYESTTLVQTRNADTGGAASAFASAIGLDSGSQNSVENYKELMKSRRVLNPIIDDMEWKNEKDKPEAAVFAKKYLDIKNTKKTNLISVTAKGKTPEEAQKISQSVVDNFLLMQTDMNQQTQSLLLQFLQRRIEEAKKDAEDARIKFAEYQKEHNIFSPDEQAKAAVAKMKAYDEAISDMQVQEKASAAKLDAVNAKLGDIGSSSRKYNINDNEIVMGLRKEIVANQVSLVSLREHYTEEHPEVIILKQKIGALQSRLSNEINTIVASKYTTMNKTQAGLIGEQANAEVNAAVAKASEEAVKQRRDEEEKSLAEFPKAVLEYMNLQRDTSIKEQIYTNLVQQAEEKKIKEAMESMDVQVVDPANLPDVDKPSSPKKILITILGGIVGIVISLIYCVKSESSINFKV